VIPEINPTLFTAPTVRPETPESNSGSADFPVFTDQPFPRADIVEIVNRHNYGNIQVRGGLQGKRRQLQRKTVGVNQIRIEFQETGTKLPVVVQADPT